MFTNKNTLPARIKKIYLPQELAIFDGEMKHYLIEKTLTNGEKIKVYNETQYLKDNKALNQDGAVILKVSGRNEDDDSDTFYTPAYEILSDKLFQWKNWKYGQEIGELRRLEQLDEVAKNMKI